ncbi:MAG: FG-GAP repeat-containing [Planctomycetota bacterium]|nr:MAG: FG-GAP repeat-containing [Planctomycetota bacterium]
MRTFLTLIAIASLSPAEDACLKEAPQADTQQGAPHGIGLIDVNQDGRQDVVVDQIRPSGINIFMTDAKGGLTGDYNKMLGTRMGPNWGMAADVDGDGFRDFCQMDNNSTKLTVYKGSKGKLGGGSETDLGVGWPIAGWFHDMNGDKRPDFIVVGWPDPVVDKTPGRLKVMLGPTLKESFALNIPECGAVVAGDVTGDKKPDVITSDQKGSILLVYPGAGNGLFAKDAIQVKLDEGGANLKPNGMAIADLDGDKALDLAIACEEQQFVRVLKGDGKGGFVKLMDIVTARKAKFVVTGDFNGDKNVDLACGACVVQANATWSVTIQLNDGKGAFTQNCEFTGKGNFHRYSAAVGDYDGDKKDDLVVAVINEDEGSGSVRRYLSKK